jgi:hypothetical protein
LGRYLGGTQVPALWHQPEPAEGTGPRDWPEGPEVRGAAAGLGGAHLAYRDAQTTGRKSPACRARVAL